MITPSQARMARAALKWGVREVAQAAKVSPATVTRFETEQAVNASTIEAIQRALESAGIEFTNGAAPGARLRNWQWFLEIYEGNKAPPLPPEYFPGFEAAIKRLSELKGTLNETDVVRIHCPSSATAAERDAIKALGGITE
jgi:transcriptional regulator with XRE-family HTH domain